MLQPDLTLAIDSDLTTGEYAFQVLDGWTGTLTPSKTGHAFAPDTLDFAIVSMSPDTNDFIPTAHS
ncbi:MAG: hypothetical protein NT028_12795 [candidate division Zixibacteria bacterium]|nr:hypothetical protein [candidate division Zixibacteria bacterium]